MYSTMRVYPVDWTARDVGSGETAFSNHDAQFADVIFGVDIDPANAGTIRHWCVGYWDAMHPYSAGAYVDFMMEEGHKRVRATYRDNYDRLALVKAQYDPDNVFCINQNIHPRIAGARRSGAHAHASGPVGIRVPTPDARGL